MNDELNNQYQYEQQEHPYNASIVSKFLIINQW